MSLDELREDLARNIKDARTIVDDRTRAHLENTLWPFLEAIIDVVDEMDDAVAELVDQQEDYLQPETAGLFAAIIQSSLQLVIELRKRAPGDKAIEQMCVGHERACEQAMLVLGEVTMIANEDDEEEGEDAAEAEETNDE